MLKAVAVRRASEIRADRQSHAPIAKAVLEHDERHLRRRTINLADGRKVFFDLPETVVLDHGDVIVLHDGSHVEIVAADEPLYEVVAVDPLHLIELAWHIGNRHLAAAIEHDRILIRRDHVIKAMLEGLRARVTDVTAPFNSVRGAYSGEGNPHHQDRGHSHDDHGHEEHDHGHDHDDHHHGNSHRHGHHHHD